jgi:DNA-binding NtrC family response regulator
MNEDVAGSADAEAPGRAREATVLVVDDHPEVVALIATVLEAQGHRVMRASTVAAARQALDGDEACDVVLTDINLPGDSGLRLVSGLRAAGHPASIVLMSGLPAQDTDEVPDDVTAFLQKPFSLSELTGAVDDALRSG